MHTIRIDTKAITKTWAIALAGIIIIAAVACGSAYYYLVPPASEQTIKIGAPFPMTGDAMFYGENCLKIIQMLADDINAQGGILGKKVEIVVEDGKCDPPAGLTAIQRLIYTDKVDLMFGAICSSIGLAAGPSVQSANMPMIMLGESNPSLQSACGKGGWDSIFTQSLRDDERAKIFGDYMTKTMGDKTFCVVYLDIDWAKATIPGLNESITKNGGQILSVDLYQQGELEFRPILTKIIGLHPDGVIFGSYSEDGERLLTQMYEVGLRDHVKHIYSCGGIVNQGIADTIGPEKMEGIIENDPFMVTTDEAKRVNDEFKKVSGQELFGDAALGYMAMYIYWKAIEKAGTLDANTVKNTLKSLTWSYFNIMDVSFDEYNHAHYPLFIKQYVNGEVKFISMVKM